MDKRLPLGWEICNLSRILRLKNGFAFKSNTYASKGIPIIRISDICDGVVTIENSKLVPESKDYSEYQIATNDILIAMSGATTGKFGIYKSVETAYLNQRVGKFELISKSLSSNDFVFYLLYSLKSRIEESAHGGAQPNISSKKIEDMQILLPPLKEQHRIVSKVEELLTKLENGIESLKTAQKQLKVYRQSLLKHAFEGKLTGQWRKNNPDKLESTEKLLERIKREREARYNQQLKDWKGAVKAWEDNAKVEKKPSKPKLLKSFTAFSDFELKKLPLVPKTWFWGKLGNVTTGVEYGTSNKSSKTGEIPVVRMGNLQNGRIDWADLVYTSDSEEIKKYTLKKGDILFNRTNSPELVGKTAKYMGEKPALFAGYLIRVNQIGTIVLSDYLSHFLNSYTAKQYGNSVKTDGVNQSNINGEKLQNYPFPFTSLSEQLKIVEILEEKLSLTDKSIVDVGRQLAKSEALRQSILKKAFSGQLLQQDLNDEPASELLNRIAEEKVEIEAQIKVTKTAAEKAKSKTSSK